MEHYETLISVDSLAERIEDPRCRIVDCRFALLDPEQGRRDYDAGHLPGAVYANLDRDLAAPVSDKTGRHPLPDADDFVATLRRWGISNDSQVVAYDDASGGLAARLWWMLRWLGHRNVALLDGDFAAWQAAGLPLSDREPRPLPGDFSGDANDDMSLDTGQLMTELAAENGFVLVDARDAARFRGEIEPIDPVAGHVPGAVNFPFSANLGDEGRWLGADELRALWREVLPGEFDQPWAVMCGSGVTACHLAVSAELAGLTPPRLYVGSWSEWTRDPGRPVAVGSAVADPSDE